MSRGKAINVKIATTKVIKALETKLAQIHKDKANQKENEAKYKKAQDKWSKEIVKLALANTAKARDVSANTNYRDELHINFTLPAGTIELPEQPERDFETLNEWQYKEMVDEIENAIRILKMSDEEFVNATTMKQIASYL